MTKWSLTLCGVLLAAAAAAQVRVDVQLMNIVATVTDDRGRYVTDLVAEDFILEEDGVGQKISHFTFSRDLPVSVGILLDTSISMERKIGTATRAVDRFIRDIHPDDDIFLLTFDQSVRMRQDFTDDRNKLADALDDVDLGYGTSLNDAVVEGTRRIRKGRHPKKALLLIGDGMDTSSDRDEREALTAVRESEVLLYALGIAPDRSLRGPMSEDLPIPRGPSTGPSRIPPLPGGGGLPFPIPLPGPGRRQFPGGGAQDDFDTVNMDVMNAFADESGGKAWLVTPDNRRNRLQEALDQIADELRNQYSLGYYPSHGLKDGKWHRISIRLKNLDYRVRYREDYFGQ